MDRWVPAGFFVLARSLIYTG